MKKLISGTIALLACLLLQTTTVKAQVVTAGPDSVVVPLVLPVANAEQNEGFFLSTWKRPAKAAVYSAILPGLGQAYNKAYWKIPIIYATGGVLGYFVVLNNTNYQDLRQALLIRNDGNADTKDKFNDHPILGVNAPRGTANIRFNRDNFRRNRDLTILISILAYTLNIAEAYVDAHLDDFDVSENLSMSVKPNFMQVPGTATTTPGLTLILTTRAK